MLKRATLVVCLVSLGWGSRALADARTADILMRECQRHFNAMEYELAASKCEAALRQDPTVVGAMRYLAVINRGLGKKTGEARFYRQCIAWAEMYLRERPKSKFTDRMRDEINVCRKGLGQKALPKIETQGETGALVITCDVDGATVTIDDLKRGGTPLNPVQVSPGRHTVTVYKYGYLPFTTTVDVITKQVQELKVTMVRDPNAPTEVTPRPVAPTGEPTVEKGAVRVTTSVSSARVFLDGKPQTLSGDGSFDAEPGVHLLRVEADGYDPWERRVAVVRGQVREVTPKLRSLSDRASSRKWAWTLTAVAAGTAAVGTAFGILEMRSFDQARDLYEQGKRGLLTPNARSAISDRQSTGRRWAIISGVSLGVSLVALTGAIYFWIRERGDERPAGEAPALALQPTLFPGGGGLVLTRGFGR
jgi:hypothetical protein